MALGDARLTNTARGLRRNQTDAEARLWSCLRARQSGGAKFRRQVPFPPYVADCYCDDLRLVIEVDGGQHAEQRAADSERDEFFERRGIKVLRFWNNDVLANTDGVLEVISRCVTSPSP